MSQPSDPTPPQQLPPTPPAPQPQSSTSAVNTVAVGILFSCLGCTAIGAIGSLGYPAVFIGILGLVGCIQAFRKAGPQHRTKSIIGAIASFFIIFAGIGEGSKQSMKEDTAKATSEAEQKRVAADQQKQAALSSQLSQLPASASAADVVTLCNKVQSLGTLPESDKSRCGEAYLQQGKALLDNGKPGDAIAHLEQAERMSTQKEAVTTALATAKELQAQQRFKAALPDVSAKVSSAKTFAGQKEWEAAETELNAAAALLKPFEGTVAEKSKEWATLAGQLTQQRKRIQPGLNRIKAQLEAEKLLEAVRGPKPKNSAWDGSVLEVERYLKLVMNDPDSYEHVSSTIPVARGEYWIVRSTFRGKNAFGGKVINTKFFYIQQGQVVRAE